MLIKKIYYNKLNSYREKIDKHLNLLLQSEIDDQDIREMLNYTLQSGRRFRPLLFILAHKIFLKELKENAYEISASIEFLHKASLIHDDLVDDDSFRRGKMSFHQKYGEKQAVIAGDLLVSLAFENYLQNVTDSYLLGEWAKLYRLLAMGELQDLIWENNWEKSSSQIMEMIYGKTASFLEFVMKAGTYLATENRILAEHMGNFGKQLGFAFQIMNDLNNWHGLEIELGRLPQNDIITGKVNLVTCLVHSHTQNVYQTKDLEDKIIIKVKSMAKDHILAAQQILNQIGVNNRYTEVLVKILNEFDQDWFWVDRDDK